MRKTAFVLWNSGRYKYQKGLGLVKMKHLYIDFLRTVKWAVVIAAVIGIGIAFSGQVFAQDVVLKDIYYFQPPGDGSGMVGAWGSEPIGHLGFHLGIYYDYEDRPLEWTDPDQNTHILIYNQHALQFKLGFGILDRINISASMAYAPSRQFNEDYRGQQPINLYINPETNESTDNNGTAYSENYCPEGDCIKKNEKLDVGDQWKTSTFGDVRMQIKGIIFNRELDNWGLAALLEVGLPTGEVGQFMSDSTRTLKTKGSGYETEFKYYNEIKVMTLSPRLIIDLGNTWWTVVFNAAYKFYAADTPVRSTYFEVAGGNELIWNLGAMFRPKVRWLELMAELQSRTLFEEFYQNENINYMEALLSVRGTHLVNNPVRWTIGAGFGLMDGVGTPRYRFYVGIDAFIRQLGLAK